MIVTKTLINAELKEAFFTPRVIIPGGVPTAGDNFKITCVLQNEVVDRLTETATVLLNFVNPPGGRAERPPQNESAYILQQSFDPGRTSDAGIYRCLATVILTKLLVFQVGTSRHLRIQSNVQ